MTANVTMTDLFCGAGGSSTGAVTVPGVSVRLAANHWALAIETHNANHPDTDHLLADISQTDPRYVPTTDLLWASPECFTAGHLVTTARGQVPIELVEVGDLVLTHRNRWREVIRVQARQASNLVTVRGQGHPGIVTTSSHQFWARPSDLIWQNDVRQYRRQYADAGWLRAGDLVDAHAMWATPTIPEMLPVEPLPPVFADSDSGWWLLGRWLGDGSLSFGRNHEVTITCGFHEAEELGAVLSTTGVRWTKSEKRTAAVFTASCADSRDWLAINCGHGAANKQTPPWATSLGEAERRSILHGYMSADGGTTQRRHRASTVSRALAISVRLLAESLGHRVAMSYDKRTTYAIEGRTGVAKRQWILHWEPVLSATRSPEAFELGNQAWSRVREVSELPGTQTVYNIEVDEDHSYVLDGIVVKNCTNHSRAKGSRAHKQPDLFGDVLPDEAAQRSRATMWDVVRFTEVHGYRAVLVENVVEVLDWSSPSGTRGGLFDAWLQAMHSMGYQHRVISLNSMHAQAYGLPAPQSRDRVYIAFWRDGERVPDFDRMQRPPAWCPSCDEVVAPVQSWKRPGTRAGRYRAQYVYRCPKHSCKGQIVEPGWLPAASIIDWSNPGTRIGDRAKPLAEKTMRRIQAGIDRYWAPLLVEHGGNPYDAADPKHPRFGDPDAYYRAWPVTGPSQTMHTRESKGLAWSPVLVPVEGREGKQPASADEVMRTMTTRNETGVAWPAFMLERRFDYRTRELSDPIATITAEDTSKALVAAPFIAELRGGGSTARPTTEALATVTASGNHHALVVPSGGTWNEDARPTGEALRTVPTREAYALVMRMNNGRGDDQSYLSTPASEPIRSITTTGHQAILRGPSIDIDDVYFRMLEPGEIKQAMAFPADYIMRGNRREQVKQSGNAVTPPAARDLIATITEAITGEAAA